MSDSRYGEQVKVTEARPLPPSDVESLRAYLRRVKHVGPKRADALIARYGNDGVLAAVDRNPVAAFRAAGLTAVRAREAADAWNRMRVTRGLHLLLAPHGLGYLAKRIEDQYGPEAYRIVQRRPVRADQRVRGRLPRSPTGSRAASPRRPMAPARCFPAERGPRIVDVLSEAERNGSTCMPIEALLAAARELLGAGPDGERAAGVVRG